MGKLPGLSSLFFPWSYRRATIFTEFGKTQAAAKVKPPPGRDHYLFTISGELSTP